MSHYKPYPAYRDSGVEWIGQVPSKWEVKPIKIVATFNDDVLPDSTAADTPISYVDISSVSYAAGIGSTEEMLFGNAPSRARRKAKVGDVVISTVRTYLKAVAAVDAAHADCVYSTGFAVLRSRTGHIEPNFLKWLALNELFIQSVESHSEGLSYPAINAPELVNLKTVMPSLPEQATIAVTIDRETARFDALIAKKTRFIELLKEKRQALITHAVTKGLDPNVAMKDSGVEWIGEVPEHWEATKLKHVAAFSGGGTPSKENPDYWNGCIPWVSPKDMKHEVITDSIDHITTKGLENSATKLIDSGAVLLVARSGILRHTIPVGINNVPVSLNQDMKALSLDETRVRPRFILRWVQGLNRSLLGIWAKEGATVESLEHEYVANTRLPLPDLKEQDAILATLDLETARIDALISKSEQSIILLKERRAAFITAAVTGQIDLRESA